MPYLTTIKRSNEPIVLVKGDLTTIKGLNNLDLSGYSTGSTDTSGSTGTPDANGYVWTLPNGQAFPPTHILLFSNNRRTYYYEDKDLSTKFQVIGKTIEQCSRVSNERVGEFTGNYKFNTVDPFGKGYTLKSLEVKTKFPFDRLGNAVETEYTLWVDTYVRYFTDNVVSITTNSDGTQTLNYANGSTSIVDQNFKPITTGGNSGGYTTGDGGDTAAGAKKNNNALFLIGGLLILIASKAK